MSSKYLYLFFIFSLCSISVNAQTKEEIKAQQQALQKELSVLNNSLNKVKETKKISLGQLRLIEQKIATRQALIDNLVKDVKNLDEKIVIYQNELITDSKRLDTLKAKYAQSLADAYKRRNNYNYINFLFSATSFNDAMKRLEYLKSYRKFRDAQVGDIKAKQEAIKNKIATISSLKHNKDISLGEQNTQLTALETDKEEKNATISTLLAQEGNLGKEIAIREKKRDQLKRTLQNVIRREIAEARRKEAEKIAKETAARIAKIEKEKAEKLAKEKALEKNNTNKVTTQPTEKNNTTTTVKIEDKNTAKVEDKTITNNKKTTATETKEKGQDIVAIKKQVEAQVREENKAIAQSMGRSYNVLESSKENMESSINFEKNKGVLPWPAQGFISQPFGNYTLPGSKIKEYNPGIEITANSSPIVKCVANGVVSVIFSDEDGYTIIVKHGKYFTTYSHLANVNVGKGQILQGGTTIGTMAIGESGKPTLFFMVSDDRDNNLNPSSWLK